MNTTAPQSTALDELLLDPPAVPIVPVVVRNPGLGKRCGAVLQTLSIYGALGIVSFGWALSRLLQFDCTPYVPLWFCSALFIYNLDRLKTDPADLINTPARSSSAARLRNASRAIAALSGAALIAVPVIERNWLMLLLTTGGALVCMNYSLPMLGFRFKDIPFLKSFFAPALVTAAFVIPPALQQPLRVSPACYVAASAWTLCVTLFNMILCDLRDIGGDARTGIRSLPVVLGHRRTIRALAALVALAALLSSVAITASSAAFIIPWTSISVVMSIYLAALLAAVHKPRPESFYEWWVEGILLVPALIYTLTT